MLSDFMIGLVVGLAVMLVHLGATLLIYYFTYLVGNKNRVLYIVLSLVILYIVLSICIFSSVCLWAATYYYMGFVDNIADAFYTAMLNYTTLGHGDLNQAVQTRIFGPMTAASGILMLGWATALLVYIIQLHLPAIIKDNWRR